MPAFVLQDKDDFSRKVPINRPFRRLFYAFPQTPCLCWFPACLLPVFCSLFWHFFVAFHSSQNYRFFYVIYFRHKRRIFPPFYSLWYIYLSFAFLSLFCLFLGSLVNGASSGYASHAIFDLSPLMIHGIKYL